jgi:periplasmic protein TonB
VFELLRADRRRTPPRGATPLLISTAAHLIVFVILLVFPLVYVSTELPRVPDVLAFVASAAPAPPPPPPPAPAGSTPQKARAVKPVPATSVPSAPVTAPTEIAAERIVEAGSEQGVPGGVEGGVPGGVIGGVVGGLLGPPLPALPPPAPPPAVERAPVRIGGAITAPALLERVDPEYPPIAVQARVQGVVILEAVVDSSGRVEDVRVLRSIRLLDAAAIEGVRKWRYSPLYLNGTAERFVLTVTVSFRLSA